MGDVSVCLPHYFKLVSFYFLYKAFIEFDLKAPHRNLQKAKSYTEFYLIQFLRELLFTLMKNTDSQ